MSLVLMVNLLKRKDRRAFDENAHPKEELPTPLDPVPVSAGLFQFNAILKKLL